MIKLINDLADIVNGGTKEEGSEGVYGKVFIPQKDEAIQCELLKTLDFCSSRKRWSQRMRDATKQTFLPTRPSMGCNK
jgi:hypothetical protein